MRGVMGGSEGRLAMLKGLGKAIAVGGEGVGE